MTRVSKLSTYKGRTVKWRERIEVYRNLNMRGGPWYSIRQGGLVVGHTGFLDLKECYFVVRESGRQRALKTGRKNVHAVIVGYPVGITTDRDLKGLGPALQGRYDMHGTGEFVVNENGGWYPVVAAMRARVDGNGLTVWMPRA